MTVIASYSIKGGVGKTTSAVNLAYLAAQAGKRTLVWDLDPQGATSFYLRTKAKVKGGAKGLIKTKKRTPARIRGTDFANLDLLPADFSYRNLDFILDQTAKPTTQLYRILHSIASEYDYFFLDCPPSLSLLSESVFHTADLLLIPMIPTPLSLRALRQIKRYLKSKGRKKRKCLILPFFCMVDARKKLHRLIAQTAEQEGLPLLPSTIPYSSLVEQMGLYRAPLATFAASSAPAKAYASLWAGIQACLVNGSTAPPSDALRRRSGS